MKIGFIGLGIMGGSMATNLQKAGHTLAVNDIRRDVGEAHVRAGARWAETPAHAAEGADIVFTSLPGPPEVQAVATGKDGILPAMSSGTVYCDLSSNSPTLVRQLHAEFKQKGIDLLDTPVSGGASGAKSGKLAIWVGGDEPVFDRVKPVLEAIGDQVMYVGPIGAGSVTKLVHNVASQAITAVLTEVFTLGAKAGVDGLTLWKAVRQGAGGRRRTFDRVTGAFFANKFDPASFQLKLAYKDVMLATQLGREMGVPMRLCDLALMELTEAMNRGWGTRDSNVAVLLQEERAGVHIEFDEATIQAAVDAEAAAGR